MELDAVGRHDAGPGSFRRSIFDLFRDKRVDASKTGGRSKCMSVRLFARTGDSVGNSDPPWDMEQTEKPIRVRNAGESCVLWPGSA